MNEKKILVDDEYIEFDFNEQLNSKQLNDDDKLMNNLESNFAQKCSLTPTNDYEQIEGDDEQTDEDAQNQLNSNTPTQRRRRKSSGRSKLNKIVQSSSLSSSNMSNNKNAADSLTAREDAPQSSSSSLSSWIHLTPNQQAEQNFNQLTKNMTKNLNSSYDTISEEEHRAKIKKRNLRSIDDDIVSSNVSSNDDLPADSFAEATKQLDSKLERKSKQQSCDSLSSSPTNVSYDSSSPIKANGTNSKLINHQNKENHLYNLQNGKHSIQNNSKPASKMTNGNLHHQRTNHQCINCHHSCFNNNNYITIEQPNIPWLYDSIKREDAEQYLNKFLNVDGVFLVRTSTKSPENYVLSFVHDRKVKHCHIRKLDVDSTVCFTIDDGKMRFYDLKQLVEFYQLNSYFLPTKLRYFLVHNSK